jgi:hypothetical protein
MSENKNLKDSNNFEFISCIHLLNNKSRKVNFEDKDYLFISKVYPHTTPKPIIKFYIVSSEKIFLKEFNYDLFKEYKEKMGLEGPWKNFFNTLVNAIDNIDEGELKLDFKNNFNECILTIIHPIAKNIKISSKINFEKPFSKSDKEYSNILFDILLSVYDNKEELREKTMNNNDSDNNSVLSVNLKKDKSDFDLSHLQKNVSGNNSLEIKQNLKRKFHSNLINPNIKKRKNKGYTFIQEEEDDNKEEE